MDNKRNFSAKREAIYRAISSADTHPSAEWIYEQLKQEIPDLSLGTVYRNLNIFKQNGKIKYSTGMSGSISTPHRIHILYVSAAFR